jgi:hypothetical protein
MRRDTGGFKGAVADFAKPVKEHGPHKRFTGLALIEAGIRPQPRHRVADSVEGKQSSLKTADFAQLPRLGGLAGINGQSGASGWTGRWFRP